MLNNMVPPMKKLSSQRGKLLLQPRPRQKLSSLQLLFLCTAAYDKNQNNPNYEAHQALSNAAKMSQIESVVQKILYVEIFPTPISAESGRCSPHSPHSDLKSVNSGWNLKWPPLLGVAPKIGAKMIAPVPLTIASIGPIRCLTGG